MRTDTNSYEKLSTSFYTRSDVVQIAQDLIGKYLFTNLEGKLTAGKIVETEAYNGRNDKACHAFLKRTKRTDVMYEEGGRAYIYLCYGIHHLFNIVTNTVGMADAILIRAIEPVLGKDHMVERREGDKGFKLTAGPGTLTEALGIRRSLTGIDLTGDLIWLSKKIPEENITLEADRRVGIDYAGEDALLPWRFFEKGSKWVSRKKQKDVVID